MPMMDQEDTMQGETGTGEQDEATSVFLPKSAFGGRPPKVGDSLKDFKVVEIDPETGDVEAKCSYDETAEEGGMMDDFDKSMPPGKDY